MKHLFAATVMLFAIYSKAQDNPVFPKGEKSLPNVHHVGTVYLNELTKADNDFIFGITQANFEADARLDWHKHPGGQILLVTDGIGYYQERNQPKQILKKGAVIKCLPNVEHWHGADPKTGVTYIAISPSQNGKTVWLEKLTDEVYYGTTTKTEPQDKEKEIINLSKQKWLWMADQNTAALNSLFNEKAVFVHMGGTMTKSQELGVIKEGMIQYKKADIKEVSVQFIGNTAILLNKIQLTAIVGGNEVINPFVVTEVYVFENNNWTLGSMSFTKLLTK